MIKGTIFPKNNEDLTIRLPNKYLNKEVEFIVYVKEDIEIKESDIEEVNDLDNKPYIERLSIASFNDIWETSENEHWDKFLASKI